MYESGHAKVAQLEILDAEISTNPKVNNAASINLAQSLHKWVGDDPSRAGAAEIVRRRRAATGSSSTPGTARPGCWLLRCRRRAAVGEVHSSFRRERWIAPRRQFVANSRGRQDHPAGLGLLAGLRQNNGGVFIQGTLGLIPHRATNGSPPGKGSADTRPQISYTDRLRISLRTASLVTIEFAFALKAELQLCFFFIEQNDASV